MPSLDVVVVNWNTGPMLRAALESVAAASVEGVGKVSVTVVDNASADGSWEGLDSLPLPVSVIRNLENYGFAAACNQGAAQGDAPYLLFLNPDMGLREDSLSKPLRFMEESRDRRTGICGVRLVDEQGHPMPSAARLGSLWVEFCVMTGLARLVPTIFPPRVMRPEELMCNRTVDQVAGAFILIRRDLFESLGGYDERFFVYGDDADLSRRAWQAGWASQYLFAVEAVHHGERSSSQVKAARLFYMKRSWTEFFDKHFGRPKAWTYAAMALTIEFPARIVFSLAGGSATSVREIFRAFRWYLRYLLARRRFQRTAVP